MDSEKTAVVVSQYPAAGTQAASGSLVLIFTSMTTFNDEGVYKELVAVPSLIERRRQDAFDKLAALGLVLSFDKTQCTGQDFNAQSHTGRRARAAGNHDLCDVPDADAGSRRNRDDAAAGELNALPALGEILKKRKVPVRGTKDNYNDVV